MSQEAGEGVVGKEREAVDRAPAWHALEPGEALERLGSGPEGLSGEEAAGRLERYGPNALEATAPTPAWRILLDQVRSVVVLLLVVATVAAFGVGDHLEGAAIAAVLLLNTGIGFVTELRARRSMEALLELQVTEARALRDGQLREIDARALVPGDVVELAEGDSVPADARLLGSTGLRVNEAALTGESLPVDKRADLVPDADEPLPDREDMVYKGTGVVAGSARAVVVSTGMATEVGRIGRLVGGVGDEKTPLERRLDALGRRLLRGPHRPFDAGGLLVGTRGAGGGLREGGHPLLHDARPRADLPPGERPEPGTRPLARPRPPEPLGPGRGGAHPLPPAPGGLLSAPGTGTPHRAPRSGGLGRGGAALAGGGRDGADDPVAAVGAEGQPSETR